MLEKFDEVQSGIQVKQRVFNRMHQNWNPPDIFNLDPEYQISLESTE
jgi:hypothetical protein